MVSMRNGMWYPSSLYIREKGMCTRKKCACGGHNDSNVKRNLNHNSTARRLSVRRERRFMAIIKGRAA